jgi:hypothetical protein
MMVYLAGHPSTSAWSVGKELARDRLLGSLRTALDHGFTTGAAQTRDDDGVWVCLLWQGPVGTDGQWIATAIAEATTEQKARELAADRLTAEVAKWPAAPHS